VSVDGAVRGPLLLTHPAQSLAAYRAQGGYHALEGVLAAGDPERVVAQVDAAGLRGRGGAAFPTARKWRAALSQPGPRFLVCNGGEDEPGSLKDRQLMEHHSHTVLEGLLLAAHAVGAERAFLYVNATFSASLEALRRALAEADQAGYLNGVIVQVIEAPDVYVAGEESAALEVIEGRTPLPRRKPPYPTESGLWGRPTVINNIETLAAVTAIVRRGPAAYRCLGTPANPGTMLLTLTGWIERPGVYEVPFGTPLRTIIDTHGGGVRLGKRLKALSPGGASTAYLSADQLDLPLEYGSLEAAGSSVGCGTLRIVPEGACMVEELLRFAPFFAGGSCGQCGPCVQGTRKIVALAEEVRWGTRDHRPLELLARLGVRLRGMGICGLITGATAPAGSAVSLFAGDFEHHARYGVCPVMGPTPVRFAAHRRAWMPTGAPPRRPRPGAPRRSAWF
jgi:NADH-quinone oxidoreductase subunit F